MAQGRRLAARRSVTHIAAMSGNNDLVWHGTTILSVRKNGRVVIAGDGQVTQGQTVMKPNAKKVRRLGDGSVIAGFAGATADAFTLFERLERKLEQHRGALLPAATLGMRGLEQPAVVLAAVLVQRLQPVE
eukprot:gene11089-14836_t